MGSIIIAVAVLLTHILKKAAEIIKPIIIEEGFMPTKFTIVIAIRL